MRKRERERKGVEKKGKEEGRPARGGKGGRYSNVDEIDQARFDLASSNIRQEIEVNI